MLTTAESGVRLDLNEQEQAFQAAVREYADTVVAPRAAALDRTKQFPREAMDEMAARGWLSIITPEAYSGLGLGHFELVLLGEELNRVCPSTGVTWSVHSSLVTSPLISFGSEALKNKYLPVLARCERVGAYCLSEPDYGSDALGLQCRYEKVDGGYKLKGTKAWITNGPDAQLFLVFATRDPALRAKGVSAFFVEREAEGFDIGKKEVKLGIRASSTSQIFLDDVFVPEENLLGEEGRGFHIAMHTLDGGRIGIATQGLGIARGCLQAACAHALENGLDKHQSVQFALADMAVACDAAQLLIYRAARLKDLGQPHSREASMAKLFASETANSCARKAVEIFGNDGIVEGSVVERLFRDAKITEIYEGTSEIQRLVISRFVLK